MSRKNPPAVNLPAASQDGNFGVGFFVGVVSGALGMFLFGTKQGHRLLAHLKEELASDGEKLLESPTVQKLLPTMEETKIPIEKAVGTLKSSFPKFQKKQ